MSSRNVSPTPPRPAKIVARNSLYSILLMIGLTVLLLCNSPFAQADHAAQRSPTPTPTTSPLAEVIVDSLPVRSCPAAACTEVGTLSAGDPVEILGCLPDGNWCQVNLADGQSGWITSSSVRQAAGDQAGAPGETGGGIELISIASDGAQGSSGGYPVEPQWQPGPSISADGRYVAFSTWANNLVEGDTNNWEDVFVRDRQTGQTDRVSVDAAGLEGNGWSNRPAISASGRYVVFVSSASNLVSDDTNESCDKSGYPAGRLAEIRLNCADVFVYDRELGEIHRVSVASTGTQANGASGPAAISADGRYVAFWSKASNLVEADTNETDDVFVHDRQTSQTTRVSVASDGSQAGGFAQRSFLPWSGPPAISADGRYVAFWSDAGNLVENDTNDMDDVFIHDQQTGQTDRVSVTADGSEVNGRSGWPAISADGRTLAFVSEADNLVEEDTNQAWDIFVYDRQTGQTGRVSAAAGGAQAEGESDFAAISAGGRYVAFSSQAGNLVEGDTNETWDIFIHDRQTGQTHRVSTVRDSSGDGPSFSPALSADGLSVAFWSNASSLVEADANDEADVFVFDQAGAPDDVATGPALGEITFAAGVTPDLKPLDPARTFEQGITEIHAIFSYLGMSKNYTWDRVWLLDGQEVLRSSSRWSEAEAGILDYTLDASGAPLPAGEWTLEIYVENELLATGAFAIAGEMLAEEEPAATPVPTVTPAPAPVAKTYLLAYTRYDGSTHNMYIGNTNGQNERLLFKRAAGPSWSPNGQQLFFMGLQGVNQQYAADGRVDCDFGTISDGIVAVDIPPGNGDICQVFYGPWKCERKQIDVQSPPSDVCEQSGYKVFQNLDWKEGTARWANVASDSSAVAYDARPGDTYRIYFRSILNNAQYHFEILGEQADWSPNAQQLVYRSGRDNKQGLWISNRDDTGHVNITVNGTDSFPAWSRDGRTIAFSRQEAGNTDIYTINIDGSNLKRLTDAPGHDILPTYTPGGEIIFRSDRGGSWGIWKMNGNGSNQREIIPNAGVGPDWAYSRMDVYP